MYFDKVDANLMNLAHERSERAAADTCNGHLSHLRKKNVIKQLATDLAMSHDLPQPKST